MTTRLWVIVVLAACILTFRAVDLWRELAGTRGVSPGVVVAPVAGDVVVQEVARRNLLGEMRPAASAGVRPGDVVLAVHDESGRRMPVRTLVDFQQSLRELPRDASWGLEVRRVEDGGSGTLTLEAPPSPRPRGAAAMVTTVLVRFIVPVLAVVTALLIGVLRPEDGRAFVGALLFLGFTTIFGVESALLPDGIRQLADVTNSALNPLAFYFFMHFFLVFPSSKGIDRALPWLKFVLLVPTALLSAILVVSVAAMHLRRDDVVEWLVEAGTPAQAPLLGLLVLMLAIGLVSLVVHAWQAETVTDRRRMTILLTGAVIGLFPLVLLGVFTAQWPGDRVPLWFVTLVLITLPLFPLSFIYAVVRHRVLGVQLIVKRGVQYALLSRGFVAVEAVLIFTAVYFAVGPLLRLVHPQGDARTTALLTAALMLVLPRVISRLNARIRPAFDRRFFRERYNAEGVLSEVAALVRRHVAEPDALRQGVAREIARVLYPTHAGIFLRSRPQGGQDGSRLGHASEAAYACVDLLRCDPDDARVVVRVPPPEARFAEDGLFATALQARVAQEPAPLEVDLQDTRGWLRGLAGSGALRNPLARGDRQALERLGTALVVPLVTRGSLLGWVSLGDKLSEEPYTRDDLALLGTLAEQMAIALDYSSLVTRLAEQEALRREVEIAGQVQEGLYPQTRPALATLDYEGACRMARGVGGDYYDFLALRPGVVGIAVGDIAGKGVSAALLMASLQAMLRSRAALALDDLERLTAEINDAMVASTAPSKFATLFYGVYDDGARRLRYVNAGHNPPLLWRAREAVPERLPPTGVALGLFPGMEYGRAEVRLDPGDLLVIFSDGVVEALDGRGEEFDETRLLDLVTRHREEGALALRDAILGAVERWTGDAALHDDVTVVVLRGI
jgi:phosphoserine phosphatase RsbU/P